MKPVLRKEALGILMLLSIFLAWTASAHAQAALEAITQDNAERLTMIEVLGQEDVAGTAFAPDGSLLAVRVEGVVQLWDMSTSSPSASFDVLGGGAMAFSPDGAILAVGSGIGGAGTVQLWDTVTQKLLGTLEGNTDWVSDIAFSPDGRLMAVGGQCGNVNVGACDDAVRLWDTASRALLETLSGDQEQVTFSAPSVVFSANGDRLFIVRDGGRFSTWNVADASANFPVDGSDFTRLAISLDGRMIVISDRAATLQVFDTASWERQSSSPEGISGFVDLTLNADATLVVSRRTERYVPPGATPIPPSGDALMDLMNAMSAMETLPTDQLITIWSAQTGDPIVSLDVQDVGRVTSVSLSPDGLRLAVGTDVGVQIWAIPAR